MVVVKVIDDRNTHCTALKIIRLELNYETYLQKCMNRFMKLKTLGRCGNISHLGAISFSWYRWSTEELTGL